MSDMAEDEEDKDFMFDDDEEEKEEPKHFSFKTSPLKLVS